MPRHDRHNDDDEKFQKAWPPLDEAYRQVMAAIRKTRFLQACAINSKHTYTGAKQNGISRLYLYIHMHRLMYNNNKEVTNLRGSWRHARISEEMKN